MAKKIKLPLAMGNGVTVRTLEELQENWDLERIVEYYHNGRLVTWLNDRYYTEIVEQLNKLNAIEDPQELQKQLCSIFGVEFTEAKKVDVQAITERDKKYSELRKITADDTVLENDDKVAFTQKELQDLLDKKMSVIYLVPNTYVIPLNLENVSLIGIGDGVTVQVFSDHYIDFEKQNVTFKNIKFDDNYWKVALPEERQKFEKLADEKYDSEDYIDSKELYQKAAVLGSGSAYTKLGEIYFYGNGVDKDLKIAFDYFEKAAKLNDGQACSYLGDYYRLGTIEDKNGLKALEYYKKAIENKFYGAYSNMGLLYWFGCPCLEQNGKLAIDYFNKAVEHGRSRAKYFLGLIYAEGKIVAKDIDKAISYYIEAGKEGVTDAYYNLGCIYKDGDGVDKNIDLALEYFEKSGDGGDPWGYVQMGLIYNSEYEYRYQDKSEKWFKKAGANGLPEGYYFLGEAYWLKIDNETYYHTDRKEAAKWLEKAAEMGYVPAYGELCKMYSSWGDSPISENMLESWIKAEQYWEKGIELGSTYCMSELADRYLEGRENVEKKYADINPQKAFDLYIKGVELDDPWCMSGLAKMYLHGVEPAGEDLGEARKWIDKAIDKKPDIKYFQNLRNEIINALNPKRTESSSSDSNCFITTAVCGSLNKPDDCDELMSMRWLRDKLKMEDSDMATLIAEYYRVAPLVVKKIDSTADASVVYRQLWENSISKIYNDIKQNDYRDAKLRYINMLEDLCARYDEPLACGIRRVIRKVRLHNNK